MDYVALKGGANGMELAVITEIAQYFERERPIGYQIPPNYPLVGRDLNVTRVGIHADGLLKDEEIFVRFRHRKNSSEAATCHSGQFLRYRGNRLVDQFISAIAARLAGRQARHRSLRNCGMGKCSVREWARDSISDEEMTAQVRQRLPRLFQALS